MDVARPRTWARRHPQVADSAFALLLVAVGVAGIVLGHVRPSHTLQCVDLVPVVTAWAVVTGRRLWPGTLLSVETAVAVSWIVVTGERHPILVLSGLVVAFTFASRVERRRALLVAGTCAAASFVAGGTFAPGGWWAPENVGTFAWTAAAVALGDATRSRNAYVAEIEARALRAEQTREEEARRRVTEERLRIARELHDVIAHHIAVINVQAGAATHVLHSRPEVVGPALAAIRRASEIAVKELAGMVGLLRNSDDLEPSVEPVRGLAGLSELLEALAASGLRVEHRQRGEARELPTLADLAAFRIAQESLTNAQKYGTGQATLEITFRSDSVRIVVSNPVRPQREQAGSGYGIVGMRERATAAGGTVSAGTDCSGRFVVDAVLPAPSESLPAPSEMTS
jgi:signal transduction histidine kinase